jgi:NTP pyrophosphatase (non-canonical NTP hydrolase)
VGSSDENSASLSEIKAQLRTFADERDWNQFHSPKNLVMALSGEVGELAEKFQWLSEDESQALSESQLSEVSDEIADVQIYLLMLSDKLGVDVLDAVEKKIRDNARKYPVDKAQGKSNKYTEL